MKLIKETKTSGMSAQLRKFMGLLDERASLSTGTSKARSAVERIIRDVRKNGDKAVRKYTEKFDAVKIKSLLIDKKEIDASAKKAGEEFVSALKLSAKRIKTYHELQKDGPWYFSEKGGNILGCLIMPIERVGVYVPGGKASYPSTVLMNVIPAQVAGVKEIALCVPSQGRIDPQVAAAVKLLGIKEVYRIGGAQAIAAMAYGTRTIKKVDKIVGPGNIYVATAKKAVFGDVGIDMIAGPSEVLIIADSTADPSFVAADMLAQAEHDELASSVLITNSASLAAKVQKELGLQLKGLKRKAIAKRSIDKYGAIIVTRSINSAIDLSNLIAPEHLELMTGNSPKLLKKVKHAGAIFMGDWSPVALGDYSAGPNHTLPTAGTARFSSPLGIHDFIKRSSVVRFKQQGLMDIAKTVETFADLEGLDAHANAVRVRTKKSSA